MKINKNEFKITQGVFRDWDSNRRHYICRNVYYKDILFEGIEFDFSSPVSSEQLEQMILNEALFTKCQTNKRLIDLILLDLQKQSEFIKTAKLFIINGEYHIMFSADITNIEEFTTKETNIEEDFYSVTYSGYEQDFKRTRHLLDLKLHYYFFDYPFIDDDDEDDEINDNEYCKVKYRNKQVRY